MQHVFIAGCSRSGTTLITRLFDGHSSAITFYGETFFFLNRDWIDQIPDIEQRFLHFAGRPYNYSTGQLLPRKTHIERESNWQHHKFWADIVEYASDCREAEERLKTALSSDSPKTLFECLCQIQVEVFWSRVEPPKYFVEKTPRNEFCLEKIFTLYPQAKIIHMVRDPFDFLASRWKKRERTDAARTLYGDVMGWKRSLRLGLDMQQRRPEQYAFVRFDSLVETPEQVMRNVASFLSMTFEDTMSTPSEYDGKKLWKSHTHQEIAVPDGIVDRTVLHGDARQSLSNEELMFTAAWIGGEYSAAGFTKYLDLVNDQARSYFIPSHGAVSTIDKIKTLIRIMRWGRHRSGREAIFL